MTEEWLAVPSVPEFEASSLGRIRRGGRIIIGRLDEDGYRVVGKRPYKAHRLICEAWHGRCPADKKAVAHWNGIRDDNRPENIRWATSLENSDDRERHGNTPRRGKHYAWRNDVNDSVVLAAIENGLSWRKAAKMFCLGKTTIGRIVHQRRSRSVYNGTREAYSRTGDF